MVFDWNDGLDMLIFVDIGRLVSVKGMIIRCSLIIPEIKDAVFRCLICGHFTEPVPVDKGDLVCHFPPLGSMTDGMCNVKLFWQAGLWSRQGVRDRSAWLCTL